MRRYTWNRPILDAPPPGRIASMAQLTGCLIT
jgi:hypothetical protein